MSNLYDLSQLTPLQRKHLLGKVFDEEVWQLKNSILERDYLTPEENSRITNLYQQIKSSQAAQRAFYTSYINTIEPFPIQILDDMSRTGDSWLKPRATTKLISDLENFPGENNYIYTLVDHPDFRVRETLSCSES